MAVLSDILLAAGAIGAAVYCLVLSRRLSRFSDLEKGMGGAIAVLSVQVDDMTKALSQAQGTAKTAESELDQIAKRAEAAAKRLELLLAAMHDLPEPEKRAPSEKEASSGEAREEVQWRTRRPVGGALR
ncbi:hypothetical protein [Tropicimonas sp. S265A]|uniref:hypothetical protein n=1 Tax=Tropicimonas sp. S265A TaxID=3415134 RepID=UPI003C7C4507